MDIPVRTSITQRLNAAVDQAIAAGDIVGTVIAITKDGKPIFERAAGWLDREAAIPMHVDAVFRLASLTKVFTAIIALALTERGVLALEDPVTRFIPDFRPKLPNGETPIITVRHLMTHTAGLTYGFMQRKNGPYHRLGISSGLEQPGLSIAENLARIAAAPLSYAPGGKWGYSIASDVLGEVVARAGARSLPQLLQRLIAEPLALKEVGFARESADGLAIPYASTEDGAMRMGDAFTLPFGASFVRYAPARIHDRNSFPSGGAGMYGTAWDVLRVVEAIRAGGAPILSKDNARALTTHAIGDLVPDSTPPGWGFGLGVSVLNDPRPTNTPHGVGTWAWGGLYGHAYFVDPVNALSIVILTNTAITGMLGSAFPDAIREALYEAT